MAKFHAECQAVLREYHRQSHYFTSFSVSFIGRKSAGNTSISKSHRKRQQPWDTSKFSSLPAGFEWLNLLLPRTVWVLLAGSYCWSKMLGRSWRYWHLSDLPIAAFRSDLVHLLWRGQQDHSGIMRWQKFWFPLATSHRISRSHWRVLECRLIVEFSAICRRVGGTQKRGPVGAISVSLAWPRVTFDQTRSY